MFNYIIRQLVGAANNPVALNSIVGTINYYTFEIKPGSATKAPRVAINNTRELGEYTKRDIWPAMETRASD